MNNTDNLFLFANEINSSSSIVDIKLIFQSWRDSIRDQINCLLYIQHKLSSNTNIAPSIYDYFVKLLTKLQDICAKEIDFIGQGIINMDILLDKGICTFSSLSEGNKNKIEKLRTHFNTIVDNVNKTITSSPEIEAYAYEYIKRNPINTLMNQIKTQEHHVITNDKSANELIDEIANDLNQIEAHHHSHMNMILPPKTNDNGEYEKNNDDDYDIDNDNDESAISNYKVVSNNELIEKFKKCLKLTNYTPSKEYRRDLKKFLEEKNVSYDKGVQNVEVKKLNAKVEEIDNKCKLMKKEVEETCYAFQERKKFEKMKNDNKQLISDINMLTKNINTINEHYKVLTQKLTILEEQQIILRNENERLLQYIKQRYLNQ